jgi:Na+/H+ antiporter NhaA
MPVSSLVSLLVAATLTVPTDSVPRDTIEAPRPAVAVEPVGARRQPLDMPRLPGVVDTGRAQPIEYSDWYERRLTIHRVASYATLPLFAFQYAAGRELYDESTDAPAWAAKGHGIAATGVAALFGVNTVTGVWNMWDARKDPEGRKWRTAHAVLMLAADAGFTATGLLAETAERDPSARDRHRTIAIASVAVATTSYLMMLSPFRPD